MRRSLLTMLGLAIILSGCTHALEVKNRKDFFVAAPTNVSNHLAIGVVSYNHPDNGRRLVDATVEALRNRIDKVVYPHTSHTDVNLLVTMDILPNHQGSAMNFLVNWPGFLVWAPAWNGYIYKPSYNVRIEIKDLLSNEVRDTFSVPIDLDVRHADFNRTWTEVSWLEVGVIALIGGFVFTSYDDKVTPLVEKEMKQDLGTYLADRILRHIVDLGASPPASAH